MKRYAFSDKTVFDLLLDEEQVVLITENGVKWWVVYEKSDKEWHQLDEKFKKSLADISKRYSEAFRRMPKE